VFATAAMIENSTFMGQLHENWPHGRYSKRWMDNTEMDLKKIGSEDNSLM
jgi:hypothetical protein